MRKVLLFLVAAAAAAILPAREAEAADFSFPISGRCTSSYYSSRSYGNHAALDIAGPNRGNVVAARAGTISFYGWSGGYGNLMIVNHEAGYQTYYAHLSGRARSVGSRVNAGDTIAYEGSTGNSTGPHVHFEVRRYGTKQYVPGSVGAYFSRGNGLPYDYPGLSTAQPPSSGGNQQQGGGSSAGDHGAWKVTASALNVRTGPSTGNAVMGLVYSGQCYISEESSNGWRRVWFDGRMGWVSGSYVTRARGVTGEIVTADVLNVRSGPSTGNAQVAQIRRNQRYVRAGSQGAWVQIFFAGTTRWIHGDYTRAATYN